jgi:uncharacterized membrane protein YdfJ with MMPL/SSD domain
MLDRLALLVSKRARAVAIFATIAFLGATALGGNVAQKLNPYDASDKTTESGMADAKLAQGGYFGTDAVVLVKGVDVATPAGAKRVQAISDKVAADPGVAQVDGFLNTHRKDFVANNGHSTYLTVQLKDTDAKGRKTVAERLVDSMATQRGVVMGGPAVGDAEVDEQVSKDLGTAETLAFPILFLLAFLFFRSLVAAMLPLLVGVLSIISTMSLLALASTMAKISVFSLNLVTALGLALAIDYSLFIVSRYREEMARSGPGVEAMRRTLGSAGRTVMFSSMTVAAATGSLILFPQNFLNSMGIGGAMVALNAGLIAVTVLPAVLILLGKRVNSLAPKALQRRNTRESQHVEAGFWYRLSRFVVRRPGAVALAASMLLITLGLPALGIRFNYADAKVLPTTAGARQVSDAMHAGFPPNRDSPVVLAVTGNAAAGAKVAKEAAAFPGTDTVRPAVQLTPNLQMIEVIGKAAPLSDQSSDLVRQLRGLGDEVQVTGNTAFFMDLKSSLANRVPLVVGVIAALTFVLLFLFTGSLILPLKQLVMNALGLFAMFGILVLVFQDGHLEGLLGYTSNGGIEATQPMLLFALGFGLATDYGVFLLSRIKEAREQGYDNTASISVGLERTGRIVTAAALLFAVAVGAFVSSDILFIKQIGLGVAIVVLIDATIIRGLLVPSLMQMLGEWNWWAPAPLRWLHSKIGVSEGAAAEPVRA